MNAARFQIFVPKKGIRISRTFVLYGVLLLSLGFQMTYSEYINPENTVNFIFPIYLILCLITIVFWILKNRQRKPLHGELKGWIEFYDDKIIIDEKRYELDELMKIEIAYGDYLDGYKHEKGVDPALSQGVSNYLTLIFQDKTIIKTFFQVKQYDFLSNTKKLLIGYHKKGKIPWLALIYYLRINDYDEIQAFKKSLKSPNTSPSPRPET
ncbi:hypothetical protein [uncultured Arcticibacterium sp.]|uniref:hypothetical protein n=1 Tax=uncultured Arcticibacterium sp. TaxID=2173042 RepID=UPI0030F999D5